MSSFDKIDNMISSKQLLLQVLYAVANDRPVVALESTIISHGMPYPRNKQVVLDAEKLIRSMGVIPAVCAIINGTASLH